MSEKNDVTKNGQDQERDPTKSDAGEQAGEAREDQAAEQPSSSESQPTAAAAGPNQPDDAHQGGASQEEGAASGNGAVEEGAVDDLFLSPEDSEGEIIDIEPEDAGASDDDEALRSLVARVRELEDENARLREQNEELAADRDEQRNRLLRVAADLENFRRRSQREKDDLRLYGIDRVVMELVPAVDNLERALQHVEADPASLAEGVSMIYRQIVAALGKHGVQGFESRGEPFDPTRHEAIQQVETTEHPTGQIIDEYQKGYFLHDRLLRPALVSVAKNVAPEQNAQTPVDEQSGQGEVPSVSDSPDQAASDASTGDKANGHDEGSPDEDSPRD